MDLEHQEKPKQNQSQQTFKSQKNLTSRSFKIWYGKCKWHVFRSSESSL